MTRLERDVPPAGDQIHLPGPSVQPVLLAAGITLALVGVTLSIVLVVAGALLSLVVTIRWIQATRRDMAELPLDHEH
jgi:hypothetical protein